MNALINPNLAYLFVVAAILLTMTSLLFPRSNWSKIGILVCLVGAEYEIYHLHANPWALAVVVLSPLPYWGALRKVGPRRPLLVVTAGMLVLGSIFLFLDQNGRPMVHDGLLFLMSTVCAYFILAVTARQFNPQSTRRGVNPNSLVGLIGTATTLVEDVGLVKVDGEICSARSDHPIPAGSTVRVLKIEGRILVVKKVEKLTREG